MEEILRINYQPQLVNAGFLPSTVWRVKWPILPHAGMLRFPMVSRRQVTPESMVGCQFPWIALAAALPLRETKPKSVVAWDSRRFSKGSTIQLETLIDQRPKTKNQNMSNQEMFLKEMEFVSLVIRVFWSVILVESNASPFTLQREVSRQPVLLKTFLALHTRPWPISYCRPKSRSQNALNHQVMKS